MGNVKRFGITILCLLIITNCLFQTTYAYEQPQHNKIMRDVLFKNFEYKKSQESKNALKALESACYLSIDQFNKNGKSHLEQLKTYGVKKLPKSIDSINIDADPNTHRSYTHRGWDYQYYGVDKDKWPIRKQILINTADKVFDFGKSTAKRDSFCAILYYIHILGDHLHDPSYKMENGLKIRVGGGNDKNSIIHELLKHTSILFSAQKHTHKYRSLTSGLEKYNSRLKKIVDSSGNVDSDEKFGEKRDATEDLLEFLMLYFPEMLKNEPFFYNVFYK